MARHCITVVPGIPEDALDHVDPSVEFDYMPDAEADDEDDAYRPSTYGLDPALIYELQHSDFPADDLTY